MDEMMTATKINYMKVSWKIRARISKPRNISQGKSLSDLLVLTETDKSGLIMDPREKRKKRYSFHHCV